MIRLMSLLALVLTLASAACSKEPSRWEAAERHAAEAREKPAATAPKVEGSQLNAFFPAAGPNGATRIFTAEKDGYVEAKLRAADGSDLAVLSVSQAEPDALAKFDGAADSVQSFPLVTVGKNQSSLLVNKKFQVKVSSKVLSADDRKAILATFDLRGLAAR